MPGTFEIYGLDELRDDISALLKRYPSEMEGELEKVANDFKKNVNKKFPHNGQSGNKAVAKKWKKAKLKDGITGMTTGVELTNTAPHFHLVEHGHNGLIPESGYAMFIQNKNQSANSKKKKANTAKKGSYQMRSIGFVQGKHYCEKTRNEWDNGEFAARIEKHVDKFLKKHDL